MWMYGVKKMEQLDLLLIENSPDDAYMIRETLKMTSSTTFTVHWKDRLADAKQHLDQSKTDVVLLDLGLPDSSGIESVLELKAHAPEIPVVVLTGFEDEHTGETAIIKGAQDYLGKNDISVQLLGNSIHYAIERQQLLTRLKEKRRELIKSKERQNKIIEKTVDAILVVNQKGQVRFMNHAAKKLLGPFANKVMETYFGPHIISPPPKEITIPPKYRIKGKGKGKYKETAYAEMRLVKIQWEGEDAWLAALRNITWRKQMEQALLEEKERLEVILGSIADGVIATDQERKILLINHVVESISGCSRQKAVGKSVAGILNIKKRNHRQQLTDTLNQVLKTGSIIESTGQSPITVTAVDGTTTAIEYSCAPIRTGEMEIIGTVLVVRDTTDRRRMEVELEKAQKIESLGVLAGGLAHEYNSILTGILGDLSMARMAMEKDSQAFKLLTEAEEGALRVKELTRRLLTFSRGGDPRKTPGSLPELLRTVTGYMAEELPVKYRWEIPGDVWTVSFDRDLLNLAIRNILQNAVEVMPGGGTVTIRLENLTISDKPGLLLPIEPGHYVKVTIADQGAGIAKEHLGKIFDPYFTTKKDNPGMGLPIAYSIVKKHGGMIDVYSRPGEGSAFSLYLPALVSPAAARPAEVEVKEELIRPSDRMKGVVLIMDDEEIVREVAAEMVQELGFKAIKVKDGREAIREYKKSINNDEPIDLVILDIEVPGGMGGSQCIKELRQLDPAVNAVVSSGYSDEAVLVQYREYGFDHVLPKPYKIHELNRLLNRVIKNKKKS